MSGHDAPPPVGRLLDLSDRVAVVTGVSPGIGHGIAQRFLEAGASVVLHCRSRRDAAEVLAAEAGERALVVTGELTSESGAEALAAAAVDRFGRLDVWVNNAGVQPVAGLLAMSADEFADVVDGNLTTVFHGTRAAASRMADGGAIVNVASIEALQPAAGHSHYVAAKAAVVAHTRAAALELGPLGVRVNAVAPGLIARPGLADDWPEGVARWEAACPLGRLGEPRGRRRRLPVPGVATPPGGSPAPCWSSTAGCCPVPRGDPLVGLGGPVGEPTSSRPAPRRPVSRQTYIVRRIGAGVVAAVILLAGGFGVVTAVGALGTATGRPSDRVTGVRRRRRRRTRRR